MADRIENIIDKASLNKREILLFIWNGMVLFHTAILSVRYVYCWYYLQEYIVSNNAIYICLSIVAPIIIWIFSTTTDYWNFHNRKVFTATLVITNALLTVLQPIHTLLWKLIIVRVFQIQPNEVLTQSMILLLGRILMLVPTIIIGIIVGVNIYAPILSEKGIIWLTTFKLKNYVDTRENKENLYDMAVVKNLKTGQDIVVKENDRFTHVVVNGVSGTGKTSSTLIVSIYNDLVKKVANRNKRQRALAKMVIDGKAEVRLPLPKDPFEDPIVVPKKKYKKEYLEIIKKYPDCGITVMAPNCSLTDDIVAICEALNITPSVIDPMPDPETNRAKKYITGMNPFFVSDKLEEVDRAAQIYEKATAFADTMQAIYDVAGTQDAYFAGINQAVSTNICVVCMLGVPLVEKRTCNINDVQRCMNDFSALKVYVSAIEDAYFKGKHVKVNEITKKGRNAVTIKDESEADRTDEENDYNPADNNYYQTIFFVKQELCGEGQEKMFDQARGLRNMINNFLANPRVKALLTMDNYIDYDWYLKRGKVTVVNTALEISSSTSAAFGSFFMLNFKQAVFRRPKRNRTNHFWYIDEFPVYISKETEAMFTLFRQYRVSMMVAIQTFDQFNKTANTRYLQGTVMGCATHVVFGRLSPTDMKIYQEKAGMVEYEMEQSTTSRNASILTADERATESVRVTTARKNLMEGHDMSQRDFQEVTYFTVDNGKPMEPVFGKVAFLSKNAFTKRKLQRINWKNLVVDEEHARADFNADEARVAEERQKVIAKIKEDADSDQDIVVANDEISDLRHMNSEEDASKGLNIEEYLKSGEQTEPKINRNGIDEKLLEKARQNTAHEKKLQRILNMESDLDNVD